MHDVSIIIIRDIEELPPYDGDNFFHSNTLFGIMNDVPRTIPFMVMAIDGDGNEMSRLLCIVRRSCLFVPHGHVFGEGVYRDIHDRGKLFRMMIDRATEVFRHHHCLYIEISGLSEKMFGYGSLRSLGYFPIRWIEVENSLHGKSPSRRLTKVRRKRILKSKAAGVKTIAVRDDNTFRRFYSMLKHFYTSKIHRYSPHEREIFAVGRSDYGKIYATKYRNKIIGGCVCIYSGGDLYLWHMAAKRKTFSTLYPASHMIWHVLQDAHLNGANHFHFMDVGIPFVKSPQKDFILSFGGRPVSSYRWFRCSLWGVNRLFSKLFSS